MKSIVEAASTINKAIQQGWIRAGKPKEFSIKILEEPESNFLGMTKKPAKIALIFDEKKTISVSTDQKSSRTDRYRPQKRSQRPYSKSSRKDDRSERQSTRDAQQEGGKRARRSGENQSRDNRKQRKSGGSQSRNKQRSGNRRSQSIQNNQKSEQLTIDQTKKPAHQNSGTLFRSTHRKRDDKSK